MKKALVLLLMLTALVLTGCVHVTLETEIDNLATTGVLQIKLDNKSLLPVEGKGPEFFTAEEIQNARRVALFGEMTISRIGSSETVQVIPASKIKVSKAEIKNPVQDSYIILDVPYEDLEVGVSYQLNINTLMVALEGDKPAVEEDASSVMLTGFTFTPVRQGATPAPTVAPQLPETGDGMNFAFLAVLAAAGMIGMAMLLRRKKA